MTKLETLLQKLYFSTVAINALEQFDEAVRACKGILTKEELEKMEEAKQLIMKVGEKHALEMSTLSNELEALTEK